MTRHLTVTRRQQGVAIVTVLIMSVVFMTLIAAYMAMSLSEARTTKASNNSVQGFYSAEGGLNMRAEQVRTLFQGYNRPTGTSPSTTNPCTAGNTGSLDFACTNYTLNGRTITTYMEDVTKYAADGSAESGVVEPGSVYAGMNYQQYAYNIISVTKNSTGDTEATLKMVFQSRLIPLFQFAAFYNGDLELHPGPPMLLNGRVHTNGNLYLNVNNGNTLTITGNTDASGTVNRFGKDGRGCEGTVIMSGVTLNCNGMSALPDNVLPPTVKSKQATLTVPSMSNLNPDPSGTSNNELWNKADVRIVAKKTGIQNVLVGGVWTIQPVFTLLVEDKNGFTNTTATTSLANCNATLPKAVEVRVNAMYDARENQMDTILDVNQSRLFDCIQSSGGFRDPDGNVLKVDDSTGGGMVWHLSFDDGDARTNGVNPYPTNYAVEVHDAKRLGPNTGSTEPRGLTVVTNQQMFVQGDFNVNHKKPASLMADAINVLSNAATTDIASSAPSTYIKATTTTINAAFLSGIDDTVPGAYNGGLQNYPRLHENWSGVNLNYSGSFVSLGISTHTRGRQNAARYDAPNRNWSFDTDFNNASNLPPLSPRFVYLRQLLFSRQF